MIVYIKHPEPCKGGNFNTCLNLGLFDLESIFGREWVKLTDYCFQMNESVSSKSNESQVAESSTLMFST